MVNGVGWHALDERVLRVRKGVEAYTELTIVGYLLVAAHSLRSSGTCHPFPTAMPHSYSYRLPISYSYIKVHGVG